MQEPITVTAEQNERSAGGRHDFYSEGDYWWQNPEDREGAYIQRDGQTNPNNFVAHRRQFSLGTQTWKRLEHFRQTEEVIRNLPIRNPLIWMG